MDQLLQLPEQRLFHVTVENVAVEFLVERPGTETEQITSITRHDHAYIELFACTSGNVVIDTEDGKVVLGSGDTAVIPAHFRHIMVDFESFGIGGVVGITFIRRYVKSCTDLYSVFHGISEKTELNVSETVRVCAMRSLPWLTFPQNPDHVCRRFDWCFCSRKRWNRNQCRTGSEWRCLVSTEISIGYPDWII